MSNDPEKIIETVENSNDYILSDIGAYLEYIRETIKKIIADEGLQYAEPMDKKKIYPAFNYIQFQYLLSRVNDIVYKPNLELLCQPQIYNNYNKPLYDNKKVELCYEVYYKLCAFYGFICSVEGFYLFSGIGENTLREWLSSGYSDLLKKALENSKKATISSFENSQVPILRLAAGNYKYKLQTPPNDHQEAAAVDVLPDLLQLAGISKKALPTNNGLIVPRSDTIQNDIKTP